MLGCYVATVRLVVVMWMWTFLGFVREIYGGCLGKWKGEGRVVWPYLVVWRVWFMRVEFVSWGKVSPDQRCDVQQNFSRDVSGF